RKPVFELLKEIETNVEQDKTLSELEKKDALLDVNTIEEQLKRREPNISAIFALLNSLNKISSIDEQINELMTLLSY
ncbi:MAG: hypothetical protein AB1546_00770, partial [bacterium]